MNTSLEIIRSAGTDHLCYRMEDDTFVAVHNPMLSFTEKEDEFEIVPSDNSYRKKLYIYQGQAVRLVPQIYHNSWLALCLELADTEEPYTILTVNLEETDAVGLPDRTFIDINNNPEDGVTGGATLWKLTQGITAFAREQEPERCRELHEISGQLMNRVKTN